MTCHMKITAHEIITSCMYTERMLCVAHDEILNYVDEDRMFLCLTVLVTFVEHCKLEGCIVLNEQYTPFAVSGPLYATCVSVGPLESLTQTAYLSLQTFLQDSLGDKPTDRPTDHATRWVTIGIAHGAEAKLCYFLHIQQAFVGAVDSNTQCLPFLRKRLPYGATRNRGRIHSIAPYYSFMEPEGMKGCIGLVGDV